MNPMNIFFWLCILLLAPFVILLWVVLVIGAFDLFVSWLRHR